MGFTAHRHKKGYIAPKGYKNTSNMHRVINGCTAIKIKKVGYVVKYADQRLS